MIRLKCYSLSQKCVWRLVCSSGSILLVLGTMSLGFGMKLMEFAEKPDITPVFAGIPMTMAGLLGLASGLCKKGWLVTSYAIMCVIISMLSIHMNYRFMGKELPSLPVYRNQCLDKPKFQYHCEKYFGIVILCSVAVLMLPSAIAAFLSCVAAKRTLKKKNINIFWFTCTKIEPSLPTTYGDQLQRHKHRQKNDPVALLNYKNTSKAIVSEIPQTRTTEYLPWIPNFTEIAGHPDNPGYQASVMYDFENQGSQNKSRVSKTGELSKDVKLRRENYGFSQASEQGFSLIESGLPLEQGTKSAQRRNPNEKSSATAVATSEADLSLLEQDYLNRRSYLYDEEDGKYYDRVAEDWIHKLVDNRHDSRSRLYAVSDEEDLEDEQSISSDRKERADTGFSTISSPLGQTSSNDKTPRQFASPNTEVSTITALPGKPSSDGENERNDLDTRTSTEDEKRVLFSRTRKLGVSIDLSDIEQEELECDSNPMKNSQQALESDSQSQTSMNDSQSENLVNNGQSDYSVKDSQSENSVNDSQSENLVNNGQSDYSVKDSQSENSVKDSQSKNSVNNGQSQTSMNDSQSDYSVKDSQSENSVKDSQSNNSVNNGQSDYSVNDSQSHYSDHNLEEVPNNVIDQPVSSIESLGTKDLTPHGIVTPTGQPHPTGSLHFEFEKAMPTEHAQKHWVEFDGESKDRNDLLQGRMTMKEYEDLMSYVM